MDQLAQLLHKGADVLELPVYRSKAHIGHFVHLVTGRFSQAFTKPLSILLRLKA